MPEARRPTILNVDDNTAGRYATTRMLRNAGFAVREAATGNDALRSVAEAPPDLVLLDVNLPDLSGFEVCRRLKADPATAAIPVLHLSATSVRSKDRAEGLEGGADGYLAQPVDPRELVATVRALLRIREAEVALRESEARYRDLVENATDLICTHDLEGTLLSVNAAAVRSAGFQVAELEGRNLRDLLLPDLRKGFDAYLEAIRRDGAAAGIMKIITRSGEKRYWEYRNTLRTEGVPAPVVRGMARDVTEQVTAQRALKESEKRFRELFEAHPIPMWVFDLESLRFLAVNEAAVSAYGYSREEFLAIPVRDLRPVEELGRSDAHLADVRQEGDGFHPPELLRHRKKDGTIIDVEITARSLSYEGRRARVITAQDITERRRLEEHLRQSQKMEAVGRLAGGVAHDFNNLLQAVLSLVQVLSARADSPELARITAEIEAHIRHGASLTQQLLLFSRREVSQPRRLDLGEVVSESGVMLRRLIPENIRLTIDVASRRHWIDGDAGQLRQVLMNLAVNARDAMPAGGTLGVRTGGGEGEAWVEVEDEGVGMSEEVQRRIFEPFFTTKDAGRGTGLGLAVVHGIVGRHGGRLEVESRPGEGSRLRVVLPEIDAQGERAVASPAQALSELPAGGGERVLVVEDEEGARDGLTQLLEVLSYAVTAVGSGEQALALPVEPGFQVLLTDLMLPGMPGTEVAARLRERWRDLAVILMSGYTEDEAVRRGVEGGAVRFLQKPFDMAALARELRAALEER